MTFWIIAGILTVAVVIATAAPLLRRREDVAAAAAFDLEVYRDQLAELDRDRERGVLSESEHEAAHTEIARRMLAADARLASQIKASARGDGSARWLANRIAVAATVVLPVLAVAAYLGMGEPGAPDLPLAARGDVSPDGVGPEHSTQLIEQLQARVADNPLDGEAWQNLGLALKIAGRFGESVEAYRRAVGLSPASASLNGEYAEALVLATEGTVTPEAHAAFTAVLAENPDDVRARYYIAVADYQAGRTREALDGWAALIADSPADAPWLDTVRGNVTQAAADLGIDVATVMPEPRPVQAQAGAAPALSQEQRDALAAMTPEERQEMIRGMVEGLAARLAEDPSDFEGWIRLIRARVVLGDRDAAQASLDQALEAFARAPVPRQRLTALAGELGLKAPAASSETADAAPDIGAMVARLAERLEREPNDLEGWLMLARSYTVLEQPAKAREAMTRAARLAPDNADVLTLYARTIRAASGGAETDESRSVMRRVIELDPSNPEALWFIGQAEAQAGNIERARELLEKLYSLIPADSPDRAFVRKRIDELTGG